MSKIILASGSPRRKELLKKHGVDFEVIVSDVDENIQEKMTPSEYVLEISKRKAEAVAQIVNGTDAVIIAADTAVALSDTIFGKPEDTSDASRILNRLSGKSHGVFTGITIAFINNSNIKYVQDVCETKIKFKQLSIKEIDDYIATGEPMDKAGAYAIQGKASDFVEKIDGSYENVVGLPTEMVFDIIENNIK